MEKVKARIVGAKRDNKDNYRVKTLHGDRASIDMFIYKELLICIYDIHLI